MNPADDLTGENHGDQGINDFFERDIAQGKGQHRQIADQIDPLNGHFQNVAKTHGQGIIPAGSTADTDADTCTDADDVKKGKDYAGESFSRIVGRYLQKWENILK